jgi:quinohemoprotein ethanol dehydrogenase
MTSRQWNVIASVIACTFTGCAVPGDGTGTVDQVRATVADTEPQNWLNHGRTYSEQRFSPLASIDASNVSKLGLAWTYKLDEDRGVEATSIVVDGVMYTTGPFSVVYALDATNGKLLWTFDPQVPRARAGEGCCDAVNRGVAVSDGKVYFGTLDGRLIALDALTGKTLWEVDTISEKQRSYTITSAPRIVKGKVLIGNSGAEFGVRGYVSAYDANSGKLAWRFYTVPGDPRKPAENSALEMARKTWFGTNYADQGGGGTVWDAMAYDPVLNQLYIGTGNASFWDYQARSQGQGDNLFTSSIIALNPDDGSYIWHYQVTPAEMWDFDATQSLVLTDISFNGESRKVLMQASKNGFFYVLDRTDGKLLSAEKFSQVNWATRIDMATGKPVLTGAGDYGKGVKVVTPSFYGAHNWQPMSYSPKTGLAYIPMQETAAALGPHPAGKPQRAKSLSVVNLGSIPGDLPENPKALQPIVESWKGKLVAWDPVKQKEAWSVDYRSAGNGGTLATAGNLVFQGTADGRVVAYTADTGKLQWESPANTGVMAGPITYAVNGEQYVAFMAGWGGIFPLLTGPFSLTAKVRPESRILVYKLGATGVLPVAKNDPMPFPEPPPMAAMDDKTLTRGRNLFNLNCAGCHGVNAISGGVIPDLRYLGAGKHQAYFSAVVNGALAESRGMPSFKGELSENDIRTVQGYLVKRAYDLRDEMQARSVPLK